MTLPAFPVLLAGLIEIPLPHSQLFPLQFASSGVACAVSCVIFKVLMRTRLSVRPTIPTADAIGVPTVGIMTRKGPTEDRARQTYNPARGYMGGKKRPTCRRSSACGPHFHGRRMGNDYASPLAKRQPATCASASLVPRGRVRKTKPHREKEGPVSNTYPKQMSRYPGWNSTMAEVMI